jgi:hypothetical protein
LRSNGKTVRDLEAQSKRPDPRENGVIGKDIMIIENQIRWEIHQFTIDAGQT